MTVGLLALDLGTHTGYAIRPRNGVIAQGTEQFMRRNKSHAGARWANFRAWLSSVIVNDFISVIAYEDVKNHAGVYAAHIYGGYLAHLESIAAQHNVELRPVGVGTIKHNWTGKGHASKAQMIAEANLRGFHVKDDNAADALAILDWATMQEAAGWPVIPKKPKKKRVKETS